MDVEDYPRLEPVRVERVQDGPEWLVGFAAATLEMDYVELIVRVDAEDPEAALRAGRSAMEQAIKGLQQAAKAWEK